MVATEGDTTILAPVVPMGCQVKPVAAAAAVNEAGLEAQTTEFELMAETCNGATLTVVSAVLVPQPFCPKSVYTVVANGLNAIPLLMPGFTQVYVNAPVGVKATACPKQIVFPVEDTVRLGTLLLTVN